MKVTYNGFTGKLVKLECKNIQIRKFESPADCLRGVVPDAVTTYDLSIYDSEKRATISFTGVKMEDLQFHGGSVTFEGA